MHRLKNFLAWESWLSLSPSTKWSKLCPVTDTQIAAGRQRLWTTAKAKGSSAHWSLKGCGAHHLNTMSLDLVFYPPQLLNHLVAANDNKPLISPTCSDCIF